MFKVFRKLLFLLVLLAFQMVFSQSEKLRSEDVSLLITQAGDYFRILECEKSLNVAKTALNQAYSIKNDELIARAYNIIGLNTQEFSDYNKAIGFYNKGLTYANLTTNNSLKYYLHNNLGIIYCFREVDFKKGIAHYKKGLSYLESGKDDSEMMYANLNIASAYFSESEYDRGLPYLKNAEAAVLESGELEANISLNSLYGSYYGYTNEFEKAEQSYSKAIKFCQEDKPELLEGHALEVYKDFSNFYFGINDYKNAYFYLAKHNELKEKFYTKERTNETKIGGAKIELDEFKRQIVEIDSERNLQNLYLKQSKIVVILFLFVFFILVLLLLTLYKNYNFKKKINKELVIANEELKIAKEKAEEASLLKSQFVSTISHELRTPLYGVVGITNMILEEHKELANSLYINSLKFSAKYLLSLVNDILQINKIEENKIILESIPFNITDEINSILGSLEFIANKNGNKLKCEIDSSIPEFLIGDKLRLSQIIMNLISNALKFTKNGKVAINIDLVKIEGKVNYIKFIIKDTGIGIANDDQVKIFDKFVQVARKEDDYQGTGLGLSIVQRLLELFDSEIQLESEEGVGTTFSFTIGFEADKIRSTQIINNLEVDLTSSQIFKILVVEDNKINQMVTKKILEGNNYECQVVDDGLTALKLLKKQTFDVILMDLNMPIINGFDTTIKIRALGIMTPIVALTAFSREEVMEEIISSGMNDIIVKPFDTIKFFQVIACQTNQSSQINQIIKSLK